MPIFEHDPSLHGELEELIRTKLQFEENTDNEQKDIIRDLLIQKPYVEECDVRIKPVMHTTNGMFVQYSERVGVKYQITVKFAPTAEYIKIACQLNTTLGDDL